MSNSTQRYNAAGRLIYDSSRHLCTVNYNTLGQPTLMSPATTSISSSPRKERVYDALGNKIRQTDIEVTGPAGSKVIADRRYIGSFILNCDTLERVNFGAGYLDSKGKPHFLFTDWQGNVTMTTDSRGRIEQHVGYYPYGEPWREPAGQRLSLYGGKERQSGVLAGDYDFGPRSLSFTTLFNSPDPAAKDMPWVSPYSYCHGNPIKYIDPSGCRPIYSPEGEFLGPNDTGLEGDYLIMEESIFKSFDNNRINFTDEEALRLSTSTERVKPEALQRISDHFSTLKSRPDYDGYLTLEEANNWYRNGNGQELYVNLRQIDLSGISSFGIYPGKKFDKNLLLYSASLNDGLVYGTISFKCYPNNTVRAYQDRYDFDMKSWLNPLNWGRNLETIFGESFAGKGIAYKINFYGTAKLSSL